VTIRHEKIDEFLNNLDPGLWSSHVPHVGVPLRFGNVAEEINFWAILNVLNFGSGFRHKLHTATGAGAYATMQRGVMSGWISGDSFDASSLAIFDAIKVQEYFGISPTVEVEVMPAVYESKPGPLAGLVQHIVTVLNETGRELRAAGFKSMGEFIESLCSKETHATAEQLLESLVATFSAFRDVHEVGGAEVWVLKKAQILIADVYRSVGGRDDRFAFPDIASLTVFSDNVLPAVLCHYGVLEMSPALSHHVGSGDVLPAGPEEVALRAKAITACEAIVARQAERVEGGEVGEGCVDVSFSPMELDYFLWMHGKDGDIRKRERHYTEDTIYY
jgi:hypothetical protein